MNEKGKFPSRDELAAVFFDTEKLYSTEPALQSAIKKSIEGSKIYVENKPPKFEPKNFDQTVVTVNGCRTLEAALNAKKENPSARIGVLNFASATNVGGGVKKGSRAQEECLCRCSTLFAVLDTEGNRKNYYEYHRKRHDAKYTDRCIYSPDVVVIKSDENYPQRLPDAQRFTVDVLTCAAPNLNAHLNNEMNPGNDKPITMSYVEQFDMHVKRGKHILAVAAHHGIDILILGAFGCGAFKNNPFVVAEAYKEILPQFNGCFKKIVFAVYCAPVRADDNYFAFKRVFDGNENL